MEPLAHRRAHRTLAFTPKPEIDPQFDAACIPLPEIAPRRAVVRCAVNDYHAPWRHLLVPAQEGPPTETGKR